MQSHAGDLVQFVHLTIRLISDGPGLILYIEVNLLTISNLQTHPVEVVQLRLSECFD
jgi:hypothetical protein